MPAYTADQIRAYANGLLNDGGTYRDVANAADQFGVPLEGVYRAYGLDPTQGQSLLNSAPLTGEQLSGAQDWIRNMATDPYGRFLAQGGTTFGTQGLNFNGDFDATNDGTGGLQDSLASDPRNWAILGAAERNGYGDPAAIAQIFGGQYSPEQIAAYQQQHADPINAMGNIWDASRQTDPRDEQGNRIIDDTHPEGWVNVPGQGYLPPGSTAGMGGMNPYLTGVADDITRRTQQMLGESFAGIRGNAVGSGGVGGGREGVAQGIAGGRAADYMSGQLANMFSNAWNQNENRALSRYQGDQSYDATRTGQDYSFVDAMMGRELQGMGLGAQLWNQGNAGYMNQGAGLYGLGSQQQQAPWAPINNASNVYNQYTGYGTQSTSGSGGTDWNAMIGNGLGIYGAGQRAGWWGGGNGYGGGGVTANPYGSSTVGMYF